MKGSKKMISRNDWEKEGSKTFQQAIKNFAKEFLLGNKIFIVTKIKEHKAARDGYMLSKQEIEDGFTTNIMDNSRAIYVVSSKLFRKKFFICDNNSLERLCEYYLPREDFKNWCNENNIIFAH